MDLRPRFLEAGLDLTVWKSFFQSEFERIRSKIEHIVPFNLHNIVFDILHLTIPTLSFIK